MEERERSIEVPDLATASGWSKVILGIITSPLATLTALAETQAWKHALGYYAAIMVANTIVHFTQPSQTEESTVNLGFFDGPLFQYVGLPVFGMVYLVVYSGVLYQIGLRQAGSGPFGRFFTTEAFQSNTLALLSLPFTLLINLTQRMVGQTSPWPTTAVTIIGGVWGLALTVISLRASMRLSTRDAIKTLFLGFLALLAFIALLACLIAPLAIASLE